MTQVSIRRRRYRLSCVSAKSMLTSDFAADILGVHLIHYVSERTEIIFAVVTVNAIVDSHEADIVLGKIIVCVLTYSLLQGDPFRDIKSCCLLANLTLKSNSQSFLLNWFIWSFAPKMSH